MAKTGSVQMTKLLERAFEVAPELPEAAQDRVASQLLQELADEAKRDAASTARAMDGAAKKTTVAQRALPGLAKFHCGLRSKPYPGNSVVDLREDERRSSSSARRSS